MEAFYKLFLRKHGISADLYELIDKTTAKDDRFPWVRWVGGIGSNSLLTEKTLQEVIATQTIPFQKWHPNDRFCAAVNARGWPTRAFIKLIDAESDVQLARWADHRGKTALHWAAENFGCWMSLSPATVSRRKRRALQREYGKLCTMLIADGADPNALDSENRTPFTCVLRAIDNYDGWLTDDLCDAVVQWGQHIQDAGYLYMLMWSLRTVSSRNSALLLPTYTSATKGFPGRADSSSRKVQRLLLRWGSRDGFLFGSIAPARRLGKGEIPS